MVAPDTPTVIEGQSLQSPSIEVTKNTKGYNWTVKILSTDIAKIKELTDQLNQIYGSTE